MQYKENKGRHKVSSVRMDYIIRLAARILILCACSALYLLDSKQFRVLEGMGFFREFTVFHILWAIWIGDMLCQLMPVDKHIALGSQKLFRRRFRPSKEKADGKMLRQYIGQVTKKAYQVFFVWAVLIAALGILYWQGIVGSRFLFMVAAVFYVCDLICVLVWCPFRLFLGNRCCTSCRIFNWDHLMMFTPMVYVDGFFSRSLVAMAAVVWAVWELAVLIYPERFWEQSNMALKCKECTDKLCTQYCGKRGSIS